MGGRGKASGGAKGTAPVTDQKGAQNDVQQIARQLGFSNVNDAQKTAEVVRQLQKDLHEAGVGQEVIKKILDGKITNPEALQLLKDHPKLAGPLTVRHIIQHYGHGNHHGTLGPIMLRIGLPRDRLLDIVDVLKPLRDHELLSLSMPLSLPGWQDPFVAAHAVRSGQVKGAEAMSILDWLSQMKIKSNVQDVWVKKVSHVSSNIFNLL